MGVWRMRLALGGLLVSMAAVSMEPPTEANASSTMSNAPAMPVAVTMSPCNTSGQVT